MSRGNHRIAFGLRNDSPASSSTGFVSNPSRASYTLYVPSPRSSPLDTMSIPMSSCARTMRVTSSCSCSAGASCCGAPAAFQPEPGLNSRPV